MKTLVMGTGSANMRLLGGAVHAVVKTPLTLPAVIEGPHGKAWACDLDAHRRHLNVKPEDDATLAHYIVEAPWAHPCWHSYSIVIVHLRPFAGRRTMFYLDGATHEIWVHALDPDADRAAILAVGDRGRSWLAPKNFAAQFIEITDELALERVQRAIQLICAGKLSPDTDFIRHWARLFGDNMLKDRPNARPPTERRG